MLITKIRENKFGPAIITYFLCSILWTPSILPIRLTPPTSTEENVIGHRAGLRPCRTSGIRIEAENLEDKLIIHNYGHCGMGIALSWGSAQEAVELMERSCKYAQQEPSLHEIAIIGCGVMGLSVAHLLLDKGYAVNIYARDLPPATTSNKAGGLWSVGSPQNQDPSFFKRLQSVSFSTFKKLATSSNPEFSGIQFMDVYTFNADPGLKNLAENTVEKGDTVMVSFNENTQEHESIRYHTLRIDVPTYMQDLFGEVAKKGARIEQKTFKKPSEILNLNEEIIFDCTGLGARELFNDNQLFPIRGQLVYLNPNPNIDYMIFARTNNTKVPYLYMIPHKSRIVVGGTFERNVEDAITDSDPETREQIVRNAQSFFNS